MSKMNKHRDKKCSARKRDIALFPRHNPNIDMEAFRIWQAFEQALESIPIPPEIPAQEKNAQEQALQPIPLGLFSR